LPTPYSQRGTQNRTFLSLADALPVPLLTESLVSFPCRRLARGAARGVASFSAQSTACPRRRSLNRSFLSLADALRAAPLAVLLVSLTSQPLARRAARQNDRFFRLPTGCPTRRSLNRSFLSLADTLPAVPLGESLVSFSFRRLARHSARCILRFFLLQMPCPWRHSLNRSFLSLADALPAAPLRVPLVSLTGQPLSRDAAG
jgi:hypothetical protein